MATRTSRPPPQGEVPTPAQSLETLTLMVKTIQHDQTGLLDAVIAVIDSVLRAPTGLSAEHRDGLSAVGDDLRGLVDETVGLLSDLVAGTDGWAALEWRPVAMHELVAAAVRDFSNRSDHRVVADLAPVETVANGELVSRSVRNLIGNVIRHTPSSTTIDVTLSTDGDVAEVTVADDGPGIPDRLKAVIFQPFSHANGRRGQSGLGLGLSLVRAVANLHGGHAEVRDRPGGGSVFVFRIPVRSTRPPPGTLGSWSDSVADGPTTAAGGPDGAADRRRAGPNGQPRNGSSRSTAPALVGPPRTNG